MPHTARQRALSHRLSQGRPFCALRHESGRSELVPHLGLEAVRPRRNVTVNLLDHRTRPMAEFSCDLEHAYLGGFAPRSHVICLQAGGAVRVPERVERYVLLDPCAVQGPSERCNLRPQAAAPLPRPSTRRLPHARRAATRLCSNQGPRCRRTSSIINLAVAGAPRRKPKNGPKSRVETKPAR